MELKEILGVSILKEAKADDFSAYNKVFYKTLGRFLEKYNVEKLSDMTDEQRTEFYQAVDDAWKSDEEEDETEEGEETDNED